MWHKTASVAFIKWLQLHNDKMQQFSVILPRNIAYFNYTKLPQLREEVLRILANILAKFLLNVMNIHSSTDINRTFAQSYLVFNNILKILSKKRYLYIQHSSEMYVYLAFFKCYSLFHNIKRTFKSNIHMIKIIKWNVHIKHYIKHWNHWGFCFFFSWWQKNKIKN